MNKKIITFVTSNAGKYQEIVRWVKNIDSSITIEQVDIDVPEYQSLDVQYVTLEKAKAAWNILKKPLFVSDGGLYISKFNQFPGTLTKFVFKGIGVDGIWTLSKDNPGAYFLTSIVYIDGPDSYQFFEGITTGKIVKPTQTPAKDNPLPLRSIFIPDGTDKTYDKLDAVTEEKIHHRLKALKKMLAWINAQ